MKRNCLKEIEENIINLLEVPERKEDLSQAEKAEILKYLKEFKNKLSIEAIRWANANPDYTYPLYINTFEQKVIHWENSIQIGMFNMARLNYIEQLLETKEKTIKESLTYCSLFIKPEHGSIIKEILETHGYTNKGIWVHSGNINAIGAAFSALKDNAPNNNSKIKAGKYAPQIKAWCKEFGIIAYTDKETTGHVTVKNLQNQKNNSAITEFVRIFSTLK